MPWRYEEEGEFRDPGRVALCRGEEAKSGDVDSGRYGAVAEGG